MPRQDTLFETVDYPLADAFEAAEKHQGTLESVPGPFKKEVRATNGCCPVRLMGGSGWPCPMLGTGCSSPECESKPKKPEPKPPQTCLFCGKPSAGMFCNAAHKARWQSKMNAWTDSLPKGPAPGQKELE